MIFQQRNKNALRNKRYVAINNLYISQITNVLKYGFEGSLFKFFLVFGI